MTTQRQLAKTIAERTRNVSSLKTLTDEVAAFLIEEKGVYNLESLLRDVIKYRAEKGIVEAVIVAANKVDKNVEAEVEQIVADIYPESKKIYISQKIDPQVVGGIRIDLPDRQLDLTVRTKINILKRLIGARI
jgi:F0F1-type ATP synthase delta subunit